MLIVNGAGFEGWLEEVLDNAGGERQVIEASAGLTSRAGARRVREAVMTDDERSAGDPHFWLDPTKVISLRGEHPRWPEPGRPGGQGCLRRQRRGLHRQAARSWTPGSPSRSQQIPAERRLLVTNHESFGYFADRYGFPVIGTIIPSVSTGSSPSAQQLAQLVDQIKATGAPAIFLETGANPQLAEQVARKPASRSSPTCTATRSRRPTARRRPIST